MRKRQIALMCVVSLLAGNCIMPMESNVQAGVKGPALSKKKVSVKKNGTVKLSVKRAKGFRVTWKSKNKKIATVKKSGKYAAKVKAKRVGKAKIIARLKKGKRSYSLKCQVTVKAMSQVDTQVPVETGTLMVTPNASETVSTPPASGTAAPPSDGTEAPSTDETAAPSADGTEAPSTDGTAAPPSSETEVPGEKSTVQPTQKPTVKPTVQPTQKPTAKPTQKPTVQPTQKPTVQPTQKPTVQPTQKPTVQPTQKPTVQSTQKPTSVPANTEIPDLTKNMASEAKVKGGWGNIEGSVSATGAVAELKAATQYNQINFEMNQPVPLGTIEKVEFTLEVTGTPNKVSFKLYDSDGKELENVTQYGKETGTYSITIPEEYKSKTISQFSIMADVGSGEGATQTATAVLSSLLFVSAGSATAPAKTPVPTEKPTPLPKPELPPSETIENGEKMVLSADTLLASAVQSVKYNEDGSVTVALAKASGGGGICFYINPKKSKVDLSDYTKVIFEVSAEANEPVALNEYSEQTFWNGAKAISYTNVATERTQLSAELSNDQVLGLGIRYAAWNESAAADPLTLTIYSITLVKDVRDTSDALTKYSSLYELADDYGFKMGTVFNANTATDSKYGELMGYHFNSITAANEMKAYSMLDGTKSKENYKDENSMPELNFKNADVVMDYAKNNGMQVRGHVLVWDAGMNDWFFREGYDTSKNYASEAVVTARLKNYIEQVLVHFEDKYPGVIYCWDVVNEAVSDASGEHKDGDARMVRTTRDGKVNRFYEILGDHYVEKTFQYTYEAVQKYKDRYPGLENVKMYYNDFSTFYATKRDAICELVKSINSTLPDGKGGYVKLCDGVGMQSYIGGWYTGNVTNAQNNCMKDSDIELVKTAIGKFADLGVEVQVTELAVRNFVDEEETLEKHGAFYKKLFQAYIDINETRADKPLKAVSIWGIVDDPDLKPDDYSFSMNGPYCGLFDETLAVKPAFKQIHDLMKNGN